MTSQVGYISFWEHDFIVIDENERIYLIPRNDDDTIQKVNRHFIEKDFLFSYVINNHKSYAYIEKVTLQAINLIALYPAYRFKDICDDCYSYLEILGDVIDDFFSPSAKNMLSNQCNDFIEPDISEYKIEDAGSRIETATQSARTMSMLLISVAMIVLTVGGIGIMNVLFVTIKDRTREIGVLKALGAQSKMILMQFLLESVSIGVIGGILGLICSVVGVWALNFTGMPLAPSLQGAAIAFVFAVLTSAAFGFYPAWKASGLKPVDALSFE